MPQERFAIAIDGPSGAGKSTVAKALAQELGIIHLDTGAMYRALGYKALREGLSLEDEQGISRMLACTKLEIRFDHGQQILVDGHEVTGLIRTAEVSSAASAVSKQPQVRGYLVRMQREIAVDHDVIMDGRDIGTVVLPHARYKFYLTASEQERAHRRYLEMRQKGAADTLDQVQRSLHARDEQDMTRAHDPLRPAPDARLIDCTNLSARQVVDEILRVVRKEGGGQ